MNAERLSNILNGKNYIFGGKNCRKVKLSHPLFSIITPVKNDVLNIEKTIQSVLQQKYKNFQYIIVDGNSDDGTLDVIKKYNNKIDFWVSYDDKNLWEAINTGIKLSTGHIIGIINSKDIYYKNALKIVKKYFLNFKIDFLFGAVKKNKVYYLYEPKKPKNAKPGELTKEQKDARSKARASIITFLENFHYIKESTDTTSVKEMLNEIRNSKEDQEWLHEYYGISIGTIDRSLLSGGLNYKHLEIALNI